MTISGGTNVVGRLNGVEKFNNPTTASGGNIINGIGGNGIYQFVMNGFLVYDRILSDFEISEVEQCLAESYDVDVAEDFIFTSESVDFGDVEYSVSGNTLQNTIINDVTGSTSIDWTDLTNFSVSASTKPIVLSSSGDSETFNVIYETPYSTLGGFSENFVMSTTGFSSSFEILINVVLFKPTSLIGVSYINTGFLQWTDNTVSAPIDGFEIERNGVIIGTSTTPNFSDTTGTVGVGYIYRVRSFVTGVGESDWSDPFNLIISDLIVAPYCENFQPTVLSEPTSCGAADGVISLGVSYLTYGIFYNFQLSDLNGGNYSPNNDGEFTGLEAGYYFLTVTPISPFIRDACQFDWIALNDPASFGITGETISPAICGSFNQQAGRNIIQFSGLTSGGTYTLYTPDTLVNSTGDTTNPLELTGLPKGTYYLEVTDGSGCLILHSFLIDEETSGLSVPNIQEIYITEWSADVDYNYWSTANDPNYYPSLDTLKFQSTKIADYSTGLTWYSIIVDEPNVSFNQVMNKTRQGFIFNDELTIGIPYNDTDKWNALKTLIGRRWIIVFKDNNGNWWTFGYENGAEPEDYTFGSELGGFTLALRAVSGSKIITAIDEQWVIDNII